MKIYHEVWVVSEGLKQWHNLWWVSHTLTSLCIVTFANLIALRGYARSDTASSVNCLTRRVTDASINAEEEQEHRTLLHALQKLRYNLKVSPIRFRSVKQVSKGVVC